MTSKTRLTEDPAALYAAETDFCRIFHGDMKNLYLLSLLLTANADKAEQCFVSGLDDCLTGNQVFKEWAQSWARRMIIKNAIRLIAPQSSGAEANRGGAQTQPELRAELAAVLSLEPFERFAFVMSVLEGYSDRECTLLLGCTRESLVVARSTALQKIEQGNPKPVGNLQPELQDRRNAAFKLNLPTPFVAPA